MEASSGFHGVRFYVKNRPVEDLVGYQLGANFYSKTSTNIMANCGKTTVTKMTLSCFDEESGAVAEFIIDNMIVDITNNCAR